MGRTSPVTLETLEDKQAFERKKRMKEKKMAEKIDRCEMFMQ